MKSIRVSSIFKIVLKLIEEKRKFPKKSLDTVINVHKFAKWSA